MALRQRHNPPMTPVIHMSEEEATSNFASVLARVRAGTEVVIDSASDNVPIAVIHPPIPVRRSLSSCIALLSKDSSAIMDCDFARDVEAAIVAHRDSLEPPAWD